MVTTRATTATICNGWVHCRYKFLLRLIMEDKYVFKSPPLRKHKRYSTLKKDEMRLFLQHLVQEIESK